MSLSDYIPTLGGNDQNDAPTIETLEELFREREATLDLTAEFHQPTANTHDEPTAVFPYTLLDAEGEEYGTGAKEFIIPDSGFEDDDAAVTEFIGGITDTAPANVAVGALHAVEGTHADAELDDNGDVIVNVPEAPTVEETAEDNEVEA